jgi:hypothetical protein
MMSSIVKVGSSRRLCKSTVRGGEIGNDGDLERF